MDGWGRLALCDSVLATAVVLLSEFYHFAFVCPIEIYEIYGEKKALNGWNQSSRGI